VKNENRNNKIYVDFSMIQGLRIRIGPRICGAIGSGFYLYYRMEILVRFGVNLFTDKAVGKNPGRCGNLRANKKKIQNKSHHKI
jgi:hypothetical protein